MKKHFKILNINLTSVTTDEPIENVPCGSCTLCCEKLTPFLTAEEIDSGKYPISLIQPPEEFINENNNIGPIVAMYKNINGGCSMFKDNKCSIYESRPISCRQFDCRKNHHPSISNII